MHDGVMRFDTKIAIAVRDDLPQWQQLNVVAFLASGVTAVADPVVGDDYSDASGNRYLPMFRQPVLVFAGGADQLTRAHERALSRGLPIAVYTDELFVTGNDTDNRAAVAAVPADKLSLAGLAIYGARSAVDKSFKGIPLAS